MLCFSPCFSFFLLASPQGISVCNIHVMDITIKEVLERGLIRFIKWLDQGYRTAHMLVGRVPHAGLLWLALCVHRSRKQKHVPWLTSACVKTNRILFLKPMYHVCFNLT
ncbi:hypothetical protein LXL04_025477 [Taraxacum kok-saghyz]